jgi:hypothetical protein
MRAVFRTEKRGPWTAGPALRCHKIVDQINGKWDAVCVCSRSPQCDPRLFGGGAHKGGFPGFFSKQNAEQEAKCTESRGRNSGVSGPQNQKCSPGDREEPARNPVNSRGDALRGVGRSVDHNGGMLSGGIRKTSGEPPPPSVGLCNPWATQPFSEPPPAVEVHRGGCKPDYVSGPRAAPKQPGADTHRLRGGGGLNSLGGGIHGPRPFAATNSWTMDGRASLSRFLGRKAWTVDGQAGFSPGRENQSLSITGPGRLKKRNSRGENRGPWTAGPAFRQVGKTNP